MPTMVAEQGLGVRDTEMRSRFEEQINRFGGV